MKKFVLTVTLNPTLDRTILEASKTNVAPTHKNVIISAGGKGINVSRALNFFRQTNLAVGFLGGKTGQTMESLLRGEGIRSHCMTIEGQTRINSTRINTATTDIKRTIKKGPWVTRNETRQLKDHYRKLLNKASLVVLSGRNARGVPDSFYAQLIALAHKANVKSVLDTSGKALREGLKAGPFMIKLNRQEAEDVLQMELNTASKIKTAIKCFHRMDIEIVVISLGAKGAVGSYRRRMCYAQTPPLKIKNDVGCGDAFLGGFLSSYLADAPFEKAMSTAVAAGAANAGSYIPGLIDRKMFKQMIQCVKLKKIRV